MQPPRWDTEVDADPVMAESYKDMWVLHGLQPSPCCASSRLCSVLQEAVACTPCITTGAAPMVRASRS